MQKIIREVGKIQTEDNEYFVCKFLHNNYLINMTIYRKQGEDFEEVLPPEVTEYENQSIMSEINKTVPVSDDELKTFNQKLGMYRVNALAKIKKEFKAKFKVCYWGTIAGINYIISKSKDKPFLELQGIIIKQFEQATNPYIIPPQYVDTVIMDYLEHQTTIVDFQHILIANNVFVGLHSVQIKTLQGFSITHIMMEENKLVCKRGYLVQKFLKECNPLPIEQTTIEVNELMKTQGLKALNTLVKKINNL